MLVDCPSCARSYHLGADDLGDGGRVVVCARCDARWFQQSDRAVDAASSRHDAWHAASDARPDRPFADPSRSSPRDLARSGSRSLRAVSLLIFAVVFAVAAIVKREVIVRTMPRTARIYAAFGSPVNVRGLDFARVVPVPTTSDDVTIAGEIHNIAGRRVRIPRVAFEIRDRTGATLMSWSENPPAATLAGGKTIPFASEPHRLPPEGRTVLVRFEGAEVLPSHLANPTF